MILKIWKKKLLKNQQILVEFTIKFDYNFFCSFGTFLKSSPIQKETTIVSSIVTFFFNLLFSSQEGYDPGGHVWNIPLPMPVLGGRRRG